MRGTVEAEDDNVVKTETGRRGRAACRCGAITMPGMRAGVNRVNQRVLLRTVIAGTAAAAHAGRRFLRMGLREGKEAKS